MAKAAARSRRPVLCVEGLEDRVTPAAVFAVPSAAGAPASVTVFDAATRAPKFVISPFAGFTSGLNLATGDVNGDGTADVIVAPAAGGGPVVNVYSGTDGTLLRIIAAGDDASRAGADVAAADFDADGLADIVVGAIRNGQPLVQVYRFADLTVLHGYTPFSGAGGVSVAAADVTGDGTPDVVAGAGPGGSPQVVVFDGKTDARVRSFFAFETSFTGGVGVSAGDATGDGRADILVSAGPTGGPRVSLFSGADGSVVANFFAYSDLLRNGVQATLADSDGNGTLDIVTSDGASPKAFDARTMAQLATPPGGGLMVGAPQDTVAPTVTLTTTASDPTGTSPLAFTATFNEAVNGFAAAGVAVTNGTVGSVTRVDAKTYTFSVTPAADGAVTVSVVAGAATDAAGNASTASAAVSRTFDSAGAAVTVNALTTNDTTPTLTGTVADGTATVSVSVGAQTATATVTGTTWSVTLSSPLAEGTYTVTATSTDGVGNTQSATGTLVIDTTAPTATVLTTAPDPTSTSPVPFTVTFSEDVTGFSTAGLSVPNGVVTGFTRVDGRTYTFGVAPQTQGTVSVTVNAAAATDAAGNANTASATVTRTFDSAGPVVTANPLTTNNPTPTLTGTVDDPDATVTVLVNGQSYAATVTGTSWSADVTAALDEGTYDVVVTATDALSNSGTTTATGGLVIDLTAPTATVTGPTGPTNANPISFTVDFGETVTGFDATGVTVGGGTVLDVTPGVGTGVYTVRVTPGGDGSVSVTVNAGAAQDAAGNDNTASNPATVEYDGTAPTPTLDSTAADPTATNPIPFTVTFDEVVTGFDASDLVVTGGSVMGFTTTGPQSYAFSVIPDGPGLVTVTVAANAATDAAGNASAAAVPATRVFNGTVTTATITSSESSPTNAATIPVTVTFTDDVTGFDADDVTVTNGAVSNFVPVSGTTYTFDLTPAADGDLTVTIAADAATDSNGAPTVPASFTITSDTTGPTASVTADGPSLTNNPAMTFTVTFGEAVTGFDETGLTVTGGTVTGVSLAGGTSYTVSVTADATGPVGVTVNAGAAQDAAGNDNTASTTATVQYDGTAPTATLSTTATDPTNTSPISFTVTFSEVVSGFGVGGLDVTNGAASNVASTDGQTYTFDVTPASDGPVAVTVKAGAATDAAGNASVASDTVTVAFDGTAPTAAATGLTTNNPTPTLTGTVDDPDATVTVAVGGQTLTATVTGTNWSADVPAVLDEGTYDVVVTATDALGNTATTTLAGGLVVDATAPTITISPPSAARTAGGPVTFTVTYSDATPLTVTLSDADVSLDTTGTAAGTVSVSGSGLVWTVTVSDVTGDGTVGIVIAAGTATDAARNAAAAAGPSATFEADNTAPDAPTAAGLDPASNTGAAGDGVTSNPKPLLTGTAEPGSTVEVFADDGSKSVSLGTTTADATTGAWSLTPNGTLADGAYTITAVAADAVGNAGDTSAAFALVIDSAAPGATVDPTGTGGLSGTATDAGGSGVAGVRVSIREPGAGGLYYDESTQDFTSPDPLFFDAADDSLGGDFSTWFYALPTVAPGGYAVTIRVTDLAGNEADGPETAVLIS